MDLSFAVLDARSPFPPPQRALRTGFAQIGAGASAASAARARMVA